MFKQKFYIKLSEIHSNSCLKSSQEIYDILLWKRSKYSFLIKKFILKLFLIVYLLFSKKKTAQMAVRVSITASELRIGNFITSKSTLIHWEVTPSDVEKIFKNEANYLPIPITEEWLNKSELNRFGYQHYELGTIEICSHEFGWILSFNGNDIREIMYVHQLQNIYFALTGRELTVC